MEFEHAGRLSGCFIDPHTPEDQILKVGGKELSVLLPAIPGPTPPPAPAPAPASDSGPPDDCCYTWQNNCGSVANRL